MSLCAEKNAPYTYQLINKDTFRPHFIVFFLLFIVLFCTNNVFNCQMQKFFCLRDKFVR